MRRRKALQGPGWRNDPHAALDVAQYLAEVASVTGYEPIAPCIDGCSQDRSVFGHDLRGWPLECCVAGCRTQCAAAKAINRPGALSGLPLDRWRAALRAQALPQDHWGRKKSV